MKDEIKEILKQCSDLLNDDFYMLNTVELTKEELKKILDYITNLQEELEGIKDNFKIQLEYDEKLENKNANLQEENERLKNEPLTDKISRIDSVVANIYTNYREQVDYKSRNKKAIECIKDNLTREWGEYLYGYEDLLNILNGSDEEC